VKTTWHLPDDTKQKARRIIEDFIDVLAGAAAAPNDTGRPNAIIGLVVLVDKDNRDVDVQAAWGGKKSITLSWRTPGHRYTGGFFGTRVEAWTSSQEDRWRAFLVKLNSLTAAHGQSVPTELFVFPPDRPHFPGDAPAVCLSPDGPHFQRTPPLLFPLTLMMGLGSGAPILT
jgi:hypothetical protein